MKPTPLHFDRLLINVLRWHHADRACWWVIGGAALYFAYECAIWYARSAR